MSLTPPDLPRSLADPLAVEARRAMLGSAPHLRRLQPFLTALRAQHGAVPDPDPLDGGANARVLILLETPGPRMLSTGIVSRDNPTGTAANLFRFCRLAGLPREDTLIWNAVPFLIHAAGALNRPPTRAETQAGLACLPPLLALLPRLRSAVCAGRSAQGAAPVIAAHQPALSIIAVPHPSPTYVCTSPAIGSRIVDGLRRAAEHLERAA